MVAALRVSTAAARLGIPPYILHDAIRKGRLSVAIEDDEGRKRIPTDVVNGWLEIANTITLGFEWLGPKSNLKLVTRRGAIDILGISFNSLVDWTKSGLLPTFKLPPIFTHSLWVEDYLKGLRKRGDLYRSLGLTTHGLAKEYKKDCLKNERIM